MAQYRCHPERIDPEYSGELMTEENNIVEGLIDIEILIFESEVLKLF